MGGWVGWGVGAERERAGLGSRRVWQGGPPPTPNPHIHAGRAPHPRAPTQHNRLALRVSSYTKMKMNHGMPQRT